VGEMKKALYVLFIFFSLVLLTYSIGQKAKVEVIDGVEFIYNTETPLHPDKTLTAFDIFNPDGFYYAKVWTEFPHFIFKKGKMYMMDIDDDTGYQTVKRYKVVWE